LGGNLGGMNKPGTGNLSNAVNAELISKDGSIESGGDDRQDTKMERQNSTGNNGSGGNLNMPPMLNNNIRPNFNPNFNLHQQLKFNPTIPPFNMNNMNLSQNQQIGSNHPPNNIGMNPNLVQPGLNNINGINNIKFNNNMNNFNPNLHPNFNNNFLRFPPPNISFAQNPGMNQNK